MKKCYSIDGESFNYSDIDEVFRALDSDGNLVLNFEYWEANKTDIDIPKYIYPEIFIEELDNTFGEVLGEIYDNDFTTVTDDAKQELKNLLAALAKKHTNMGRYWLVSGKIVKKVTQGDIDGFLS